MVRVKFSRPHDHRWPSGAETHYPENWEGSVKQEVAESAVAKGAARRTRLTTKKVPAKRSSTGRKRGRPRRRVEGVKGGKIDQAQPAPTLPGNLPPELAEPQALTPNLSEAGASPETGKD